MADESQYTPKNVRRVFDSKGNCVMTIEVIPHPDQQAVREAFAKVYALILAKSEQDNVPPSSEKP